MKIRYEPGWVTKRIEEAADEYDSWPDLVKSALTLTTDDQLQEQGDDLCINGYKKHA